MIPARLGLTGSLVPHYWRCTVSLVKVLTKLLAMSDRTTCNLLMHTHLG